MAAERQKIINAILDIIHSITPDADVTNLDPAAALRDQLDLDSMDFLDIVLELRRRHKVDVPESEYKELVSLDSCVQYLAPKMAGSLS